MALICGPDDNNNIRLSVNELQDLDPFMLYTNSIRSSETREKYRRRLKVFFDFIKLPNISFEERCDIFVQNSKNNPNFALNYSFRFIVFQKSRLERKEIVVSTIYNYLKPIKLLCKINDININWQKITMGLPKERKYAEDRAPTIKEIQKLVSYPDRRIKLIITIMISSGLRLAAWDDLKFKHIQPFVENGNIVAAKITIYAGSEEQYDSFITPEAYNALIEWLDFRKSSGEEITTESWLLRNLWDVTTPSGGPRGLVTVPKKLKHTGVKSLMERALRAQGIRTQLEEGKKRYPFQTDHGFRKFFKTRCEMSGMLSANTEILMNHSMGITDAYYRPQEKELLADYLKAVDYLTINKKADKKLEREIEGLDKQQGNNEYLLKNKLQEKDDAYIALSDRLMTLTEKVQRLENAQLNKN